MLDAIPVLGTRMCPGCGDWVWYGLSGGIADGGAWVRPYGYPASTSLRGGSGVDVG
jgi:hypothetical protein